MEPTKSRIALTSKGKKVTLTFTNSLAAHNWKENLEKQGARKSLGKLTVGTFGEGRQVKLSYPILDENAFLAFLSQGLQVTKAVDRWCCLPYQET